MDCLRIKPSALTTCVPFGVEHQPRVDLGEVAVSLPLDLNFLERRLLRDDCAGLVEGIELSQGRLSRRPSTEAPLETAALRRHGCNPHVVLGPLRRAVATAHPDQRHNKALPPTTVYASQISPRHHPEEGRQLILARRPQAAQGLVLRADALVNYVEDREGLPIEHTGERSETHDDFTLLPAHPIPLKQLTDGLTKLPVSLGGREEAPVLARELDAERGEFFGRPHPAHGRSTQPGSDTQPPRRSQDEPSPCCHL